MSFLTSLMGAGGAASAAGALGGAAPAAAAVNPMAGGLAKLIGGGASGSGIQDIAGKIGGGMNQIAAAGGAQPGYQAPPAGGAQPGPMQPDPNNHLQLLDPQVLQGLIARFRPQGAGQNQMEQF